MNLAGSTAHNNCLNIIVWRQSLRTASCHHARRRRAHLIFFGMSARRFHGAYGPVGCGGRHVLHHGTSIIGYQRAAGK